MDNIQLSQASQAYIINQEQNKNITEPITSEPAQIQDGDNKMKKVLIGLGVLGAAGIGIVYLMRGKKPKNTPKAEDAKKLVKQFNDITFDKSKAKLKDGTLFTGTVEKVSENGDKLSIEYANGVIKKSTKTTNGTEVVKEYTNGVISKINGEEPKKIKDLDKVRADQAKLKKLLQDDKITSEEFQKQTKAIDYKSKNDEAEIQKVYDSKVKAEKAAKEKERLTHQKKAEELRRKREELMEKKKAAANTQSQNTTAEQAPTAGQAPKPAPTAGQAPKPAPKTPKVPKQPNGTNKVKEEVTKAQAYIQEGIAKAQTYVQEERSKVTNWLKEIASSFGKK